MQHHTGLCECNETCALMNHRHQEDHRYKIVSKSEARAKGLTIFDEYNLKVGKSGITQIDEQCNMHVAVFINCCELVLHFSTFT